MSKTMKFRNMRGLALAVLAISLSSVVHAASYEFTWTGSNGYKMQGAFSISDDLAEAKFIDESAIECFWIKGFHVDKDVGSWTIRDLTPETTWTLNFSPSTLTFQTNGNRNQEWNMRGSGRGCGKDGFGFHAGNAAQDVCINDRLIVASQVSRYKPMTARRNDEIKFGSKACLYFPVS